MSLCQRKIPSSSPRRGPPWWPMRAARLNYARPSVALRTLLRCAGSQCAQMEDDALPANPIPLSPSSDLEEDIEPPPYAPPVPSPPTGMTTLDARREVWPPTAAGLRTLQGTQSPAMQPPAFEAHAGRATHWFSCPDAGSSRGSSFRRERHAADEPAATTLAAPSVLSAAAHRHTYQGAAALGTAAGWGGSGELDQPAPLFSSLRPSMHGLSRPQPADDDPGVSKPLSDGLEDVEPPLYVPPVRAGSLGGHWRRLSPCEGS